MSVTSHPFVPPTFLNVTAIWAENGASVLQCWQILPGFTTSSQSGTAGASILQLGAVANITYTVLPPGFNGGLHNAPTEQWVAFLSGLAHVTLPNSTDSVYIPGGANGFIFAADTAARSTFGHITNYPSSSETRVLQIPTGGGVPNHNLLHSGPCKNAELEGRSYDSGLNALD